MYLAGLRPVCSLRGTMKLVLTWGKRVLLENLGFIVLFYPMLSEITHIPQSPTKFSVYFVLSNFMTRSITMNA